MKKLLLVMLVGMSGIAWGASEVPHESLHSTRENWRKLLELSETGPLTAAQIKYQYEHLRQKAESSKQSLQRYLGKLQEQGSAEVEQCRETITKFEAYFNKLKAANEGLLSDLATVPWDLLERGKANDNGPVSRDLRLIGLNPEEVYALPLEERHQVLRKGMRDAFRSNHSDKIRSEDLPEGVTREQYMAKLDEQFRTITQPAVIRLRNFFKISTNGYDGAVSGSDSVTAPDTDPEEQRQYREDMTRFNLLAQQQDGAWKTIPAAMRLSRLRDFSPAPFIGSGPHPGYTRADDEAFNPQPKSPLRRTADRLAAFGLNPGVLGEAFHLGTLTSTKAGLLGAGAAAATAGSLLDAYAGRGSIQSPLTEDDYTALHSAARPDYAPLGRDLSAESERFEKANARYGATEMARKTNTAIRQMAQPILAVGPKAYLALNAKAVLAYNRYLAQHPHDRAVKKYKRALNIKRAIALALLAAGAVVDAGAFWAHTRRGTDPVQSVPHEEDVNAISRANGASVFGALLRGAGAGLGAYVTAKHVAAAEEYADDPYSYQSTPTAPTTP